MDSLFSYPNFDWEKTFIIFGADNSSLVNTNKKKKVILVIGKGPTKGLDDTATMAGAKYTNNLSRSRMKFCLSLHYTGKNSFLFVNEQKNINLDKKL